MPTIKPIETRYAGCRFRSRLEARWAVFFDHLGIKWEYEREGYEVEDRLHICDVDSWRYLPDFWLPEYELHVEVKGALDDSSMRKMLSAVAYLSAPSGGCGGGNDTLALGPIPSSGRSLPVQLHMHKGGLNMYPFLLSKSFSRYPCHVGFPRRTIADDEGYLAPRAAIDVLAGSPLAGGTITEICGAAYTAARSARFEHGERG